MCTLAIMYFTFLKLQWKSFVRGESVGADITTKIFKWFWIVYFAIIIPALGFLTYDVIEKSLEIEDPFLFINKQLIYAFVYLIVLRYFVQPIPVISLKPLLLTPISKSQIVRHALGKSIFSFFNLIVFLYLIPLTFILIIEEYDMSQLLGWNLGIIAIVYITNYLNFLLNNNDKLLYSVGASTGWYKVIRVLFYF